MLPERFNRMLSALKTIENVGAENFSKVVQEEFTKIFKSSILQATVLSPK